ncbi:hypothetical protein OV079_24140 [Nannocystis pusilla]|uniref:Uncharacterized protein n=1 Tax=Nannocystis pusilla TaxID=889268 RepID=A0A9X3ESS6_9BACT|nr:hypothetical protein [Nannocystis pusilla]MCY1008595.1 hypothetical protein [Nannocystis pusilla]
MTTIQRVEPKQLSDEENQKFAAAGRTLRANATGGPDDQSFQAFVDYAWSQAEQAGNDELDRFLGTCSSLFAGQGWQVDVSFAAYLDAEQSASFDIWFSQNGGYSTMKQGRGGNSPKTLLYFVNFK